MSQRVEMNLMLPTHFLNEGVLKPPIVFHFNLRVPSL